MASEAANLIDQSKKDKSQRWLGFIQGALWGMGLTSISEMKDLNRPDERTVKH